MSWTRNINNVCVVFFDESVQMNVDEVLTRRGSPVTEQPRFDLFRFERFPKQGILKQVDLADA